jgi:hypothetical protein
VAEEDKMSRRTMIVVAGLAVMLRWLLAAPASAHEEHKVDRYTVEAGFGTEPAYAGSSTASSWSSATTANR